MNKREQDIIQKLKDKTSDITAPDSLKPEQIIRTLEEKENKKRKISPFRIGALAAACLVLAAGIAVYRNGSTGCKPEEEKPGEVLKISSDKSVASASDYDEVYDYIERYRKDMEEEARVYEEDMIAYETAESTSETKKETDIMESSDADAGTSDRMLSGGGVESSSYSETNVRQEGVDEGDVVKTDGVYLYVLKENGKELSVVDTRGGKMKEVYTLSVEENQWIQEMYLDTAKKRLVIVCSRNESESSDTAKMYFYTGSTEVLTYDIREPKKPKKTGEFVQSGQYQSSRMSDGYLYLFSNYSAVWENIKRELPETYIPLVNDSVIAEKDICLPPIAKGRDFTVVSSIDMENPSEAADSKAILSQGGQLYVSNKNIYYYETIWDNNLVYEDEQTTIRSISYEKGVLKPGAQGRVEGYINDSFSIDEYKGYLRIVTTRNNSNSVYVLDGNLEAVGSIENLAKDERVYSARLMGDTGYFVTFRETDPLFSVDLSDPKKPEIIGALKIPGFSDYLHPYGDGKLLGIGMNVDELTQITEGVKLTMFDISDPADVKEEDTYILKNVYSTDVSFDYKAALADAEKNIIGFAGYSDGGQSYYVFEYDSGNGFICRMEEEINGNGSSARGVYIEQTLYVIQGNIIEAYSLKDYKKTDDIIL